MDFGPQKRGVAAKKEQKDNQIELHDVQIEMDEKEDIN